MQSTTLIFHTCTWHHRLETLHYGLKHSISNLHAKFCFVPINTDERVWSYAIGNAGRCFWKFYQQLANNGEEKIQGAEPFSFMYAKPRTRVCGLEKKPSCIVSDMWPLLQWRMRSSNSEDLKKLLLSWINYTAEPFMKRLLWTPLFRRASQKSTLLLDNILRSRKAILVLRFSAFCNCNAYVRDDMHTRTWVV